MTVRCVMVSAKASQDSIHLGDLNFVAWGVWSHHGPETEGGSWVASSTFKHLLYSYYYIRSCAMAQPFLASPYAEQLPSFGLRGLRPRPTPHSTALPWRRAPPAVPAVAAAVFAAAARGERGQARSRWNAGSPENLRFADSEVMKSLPGFISQTAVTEVLRAICDFARQHRKDAVVTWITGKRVQVYLSGEKSGPFREPWHAELLLAFLEELKSSLHTVAAANDGEASEDIAALVGATEMQVPHTDLLPGQVQVICALTETSSTLVYDPKLPRPSRQEVAKMMGVEASELKEEGQFGLVYKSFPLVLPVKDVYRNMVESYDAATNGSFHCGDAVQIRDGIVHAGPGCEDQPDEPRVVIFMTYRTFRDEHYEFTFQAKLWDWASHPAIPPMVAYKRLQEVYRFGVDNGMDIKPWTYYPPESLEACKMLCTTPGLDEMTVELLVEEWREMLYDALAMKDVSLLWHDLFEPPVQDFSGCCWYMLVQQFGTQSSSVLATKDENVQIATCLSALSAVAWATRSKRQREEDQYELIMVMRRSFRRHFFTFFILSMAVLSGSEPDLIAIGND
eukprot:s3093_g9.t3